MTIKHGESYNIVFDDNSDVGSGSLAHLLSQTIFKLNLEYGLERGLPFLSDQGIVISNEDIPARNLVVISMNKHNAESTDIVIQTDIADVVKFMLSYNLDVTCDLRVLKAICKTYKKTQSYRKYLHCFLVLGCNTETEVADRYIKDLLSFGLPFYIKAKEVIKLMVNLNQRSLRKLLFYRSVWGEDNLNSVFLYLTSDNPLPEYIVSEYKEDMAGSMYRINIINFGIALGKGQLNKMILKLIMDTEE